MATEKVLQVIVQQLHGMQPLDALQAQRQQTIGVVDDVPRAPVPRKIGGFCLVLKGWNDI